MLKETFETIKGSYKLDILERNEQKQIEEFAEKYINEFDRALYIVYGMGGSGKTYLVKNALESIKENHSKHQEVFCAYLDISNCMDEAEVYYKIALQLKNFYKELGMIAGVNVRTEIENTDALIEFYEWIKGVKRKDLSVGKKRLEVIDDIASFIGERANELLDGTDDDNPNFDIVVENILIGLAKGVPVINDIRRAVDVVSNIRDDINTRKFKQLLLAKVDILDNRVMFENFLLGKLKEALPHNAKRIIVLDNFQMDADNILSKTSTWLTAQNKLMRVINAMWIVVSRITTKDLFADYFKNQNASMELNGFDESFAKKYLIKNCFHPETEIEYDSLNDDEKKLIDAMLRATDLNQDKNYLPYLLRMIVLYYWRIKETPEIQITPDIFLNIDTETDFVGYYFYKDLSDLMVNAFQILSCLSVWDDIWISVVQRKIDNHLLNARNLLEHKAPIEYFDDNTFKLHEALKEGLYKNKQNYIKKDVMKHLFETFIKIYGERDTEENKNIWYDLKRLNSFLEIVFDYIDLDKDNQIKRKNLKSIKKAMEEIYDKQKKRGTVSNAYINIYSFYIDKMRKIYDIPFIDTLNKTFDGNCDSLEYSPIEKDKQEDCVYYMMCCFNLADLYTNNNQNGIAQQLEELCVKFWDKQLEGLKNSAEKSTWYYRCCQQRIRALNATAYDYSAEHNYDAAYSFGKSGLEAVQELGRELLEIINPQQKDTLLILLNPEESEKFIVPNSAYMDIPHEIYGELQKAYSELWQIKNENNKLTNDNLDDKTAEKAILTELFIKNQQDLRGNYPWYCLMKEKKHDGNFKSTDAKKWVLYGVRTYWMRRIMLETLRESALKSDDRLIKNTTVKMLKSYHNICVYLSKIDEYEMACILGNEVLNESKKLMQKTEPNQKAISFIKDMLEIKTNSDNGLVLYLWKQYGLNKDNAEEFYSQPSNIVEQMQYLGDFYLNIGYYSFALKWLSETLLIRIASLGISDSKTLDTILRFYIAVYAVKNNNDSLMKYTEDYIEQNVIKDEEYINKMHESNHAIGILQKYEKMAKLFEIGNKEGNIDDIVSEMLSEL